MPPKKPAPPPAQKPAPATPRSNKNWKVTDLTGMSATERKEHTSKLLADVAKKPAKRNDVAKENEKGSEIAQFDKPTVKSTRKAPGKTPCKPSTEAGKTSPKSRAETSTARARAREAAIASAEKAIDALLDAMAGGKSLSKACEIEGMPSRATFLRRVAADKELQARYAAAMQARADVLAEETLEIADDASQDTIEGENGPRANAEWIARSKLRVAARQWFIAKVAPKKYGDKLDVDHGVQEGNPLLTLLAKMGGSALPLAPNTPATQDDDDE